MTGTDKIEEYKEGDGITIDGNTQKYYICKKHKIVTNLKKANCDCKDIMIRFQCLKCYEDYDTKTEAEECCQH